ncbi:MAG: ABC transporter permease [Dehalococcoidia bacterium]|nr:ABC transporter permease [Dehalococcoidia bacterium]
MTAYIIRRLLLAVLAIIGASVLVFSAVRSIPGDVVELRLAEAGRLNPEQVQAARAELGLDDPAYQQYFKWFGSALTGDLGNSLWTGRPVRDSIWDRWPLTAEIAVVSILASLIVAIPIGVISALNQNSRLDYGLRLLSALGQAMPSFWIALLIWTLPAIWWNWTPPLGYSSLGEDPARHLQQILIPAAILGAYLAATTMRLTRSALLEVLREDYVRTARAKGLSSRIVIWRHALRNALIPIVTVVGTQFAFLLGGTIIIEQVFALPGLGRLTLDAILNRDYTQLQGNMLVFSVAIVLLNLAVDLTYPIIDPRVHYS